MAGTIWGISNLLLGIVSVILIYILIRYGSKKVHYVWAFFNFVVAIWAFGAFFVVLSRNKITAMFFSYCILSCCCTLE